MQQGVVEEGEVQAKASKEQARSYCEAGEGGHCPAPQEWPQPSCQPLSSMIPDIKIMLDMWSLRPFEAMLNI